MRLIATCLALVTALMGSLASACGTAAEVCEVEGGSYRLVLPKTIPQTGVAAVFYLHGWGASAKGALANQTRIGAVVARGMALIVPEGIPRQGRTQRDWAVRDNRPHPRDDLAFFEAILRDAADRGVDRERVLLSGFSRGGSMVWAVACEAPGLFRAYAPLAGAFWDPLPGRCRGAVDLHHTHGWSDGVVPLEGRSFRAGEIVQGDVFASLFILRNTLGCDARHPPIKERVGEGLWIRRWTDCRRGRLDLVLHPGGHTAPEGWMVRVLDWFEARLDDAPPLERTAR
ncbi:MAG: PHB depolymerase family esterase [Pseudomonadota bacterium]